MDDLHHRDVSRGDIGPYSSCHRHYLDVYHQKDAMDYNTEDYHNDAEQVCHQQDHAT